MYVWYVVRPSRRSLYVYFVLYGSAHFILKSQCSPETARVHVRSESSLNQEIEHVRERKKGEIGEIGNTVSETHVTEPTSSTDTDRTVAKGSVYKLKSGTKRGAIGNTVVSKTQGQTSI